MDATMPLSSNPVEVHRTQGLTEITLRRASARNALDRSLLEPLLGALRHVALDPDTRVVILRGEGHFFSTGADLAATLTQRREGDVDAFEATVRLGHDVVRCIAHEVQVPVVASIDGPAAGSGLGLALACDMVVATQRATLGATQIRLGLHPDMGLTHTLRTRMRTAIAHEFLWTGRIIDAHEALRSGMIDRVSPNHAMEREIRSLTERLVDAPTIIVSGIKRRTRDEERATLEDALDAELQGQLEAFRSEECLTRLEALRRRLSQTAHSR
jgi:2-(1,2-epoxy-1,2-dihydrophenyl)acetyl-CoA isomerase